MSRWRRQLHRRHRRGRFLDAWMSPDGGRTRLPFGSKPARAFRTGWIHWRLRAGQKIVFFGTANREPLRSPLGSRQWTSLDQLAGRRITRRS